MTGLVGVIANDSARYSLFASCIDRLELPDGWKKEWVIGGDWCGARNALCQLVLDEDYDYLWFMDDDHAFSPSLLTKLLAHEEALVTPICLTRTHPFKPVQYTQKLDGEFQYLPIPLSAAETKGLVEIEAGGCAGMLIRRDVIEKTEKQWINDPVLAEVANLEKAPWFEYSDRSEDIIFCEKAKAAGFTLYADLSCTLGHITTAVVHPTVREGNWMTGLTIGRDLNLVIDTADTVVAEESPNAPAQVQSWIWELRRVINNERLCQLLLPAGTPFNLAPDNQLPWGNAQWYCDDGGGFQPVGDPFMVGEKE